MARQSNMGGVKEAIRVKNYLKTYLQKWEAYGILIQRKSEDSKKESGRSSHAEKQSIKRKNRAVNVGKLGKYICFGEREIALGNVLDEYINLYRI